MIYNLVSVRRVIAKVFSDYDLQEGEHRISDMIEWASEALEKIGGFPSFETKVCGKDDLPLLTVSNYQTKLPCDFYNMVQVGYSSSVYGPFYPMRYATGSFDSGVDNVDRNSLVDLSSNAAIVMLCMTLYDLSYEDALASINTDTLRRAKLNGILALQGEYSHSGIGDVSQNYTTDLTYLIRPGYIKTNVESGYIMLAYQAIPTDSEGYPMIPDNQSYLDAIYWYIVMKLLYPKWANGQVRDVVYYDAKRSWNYYCKQAYGNAMMPNKDQMESIKNAWLRLVPEINEHQTAYSTLGQRQIINDAT
jgi:hypothetical protein